MQVFCWFNRVFGHIMSESILQLMLNYLTTICLFPSFGAYDFNRVRKTLNRRRTVRRIVSSRKQKSFVFEFPTKVVFRTSLRNARFTRYLRRKSAARKLFLRQIFTLIIIPIFSSYKVVPADFKTSLCAYNLKLITFSLDNDESSNKCIFLKSH